MQIDRPLSPHTTIYKPQLTSTLSILHRISGAFLATVLLVGIFVLRVGPLSLILGNCYQYAFFSANSAYWFFLSLVTLFFLVLFYHLSNGFRHLWWDLGFVLDLSYVHTSGILMLFCVVLLASLTFLRFLLS
nr:succinate dehydrogenase cytochrome subunit 3 [Haplopteris ensiformis]UQV94693.1 succinate dehydrogenase cytochrome subunit 3 [Haplopteris ensiformis]UQV94705.1 succinate dehydrogenase cytochrome subunit 3 [Haplopteris ensiformis]UQV94724.1 succinate dehydrogenase cytochrome subunit 3 [Haplopteris ensiformis]